MRRLKEIRKSKNWTQEDLAARSGVSLPYIRLIERGKYAGASQEIKEKIAGCLDEWPAEFLNRGGGRSAFWTGDLLDQPNPIIDNRLRLYLKELRAAAAKEKNQEILQFLENTVDMNFLILMGQLMGIAEKYNIPPMYENRQ